MHSMTQIFVRKCLSGIIGTLFALLASEIIVRFLGERPWQTVVRGELTELTTEQDPILGWKSKPGSYRFRVGKVIATTILPDRSRFTGATENEAAPEVVLFGDSVMYGYGVDDLESIGAALQGLRPENRIVNRAVPGYGLLQSWLAARDSNLSPRATVVVNAETYFEERDIAAPEWVELVTMLTTNMNVFIPYGTIDSGQKLQVHPAKWYWAGLPLRTHSALVTLVEKGIARFESSARVGQARAVSLASLAALNTSVSERGAKLLVTGFSRFPTRDVQVEYEAFLTSSHIPFRWCVDPRKDDPTFHIEGDPHPNAEIHKFMADCVDGALRELLPAVSITTKSP